jgi:hypothetical protein
VDGESVIWPLLWIIVDVLSEHTEIMV